MENKMYELALSYLEKGWSVLPCGKNKIPLISWKHLQENYPSVVEVKEWFEKFPDAQVGIITGKISNLTVVDIENGGDISFLPQETMIVETGGKGYHYYFLYEEGVTNKARIRELVDIRSEGGFVVAAGSVSDKGSYKVIQEAELLPFPKEVFPTKVDIFQTPGTSSGFERKPIEEYVGVGAGQRNQEMARYIGYLLTQLHPADWDSDGWNRAMVANMKNTPPLSPTELQTTFNSIKRTERQNNPFGRSRSFTIGTPRVPDLPPVLLDDDSDEIMHIADVAEAQAIDPNEVYPLEMPCFDNAILGGVTAGDVITIAGQTGEGKTTLAQDWTMSMIRGPKKAKALWFSYEVLATHLWSKFQEMGMGREDCAFIPAKHSTGNVAWVEAKIKEGKEKFGIKTVFIDHLGFLLPKTEGTLGKNLSSNYAAFLTQVMRDLKTIALREEVIIFLPVHMKKVDSRTGRQSDINDIKDSSGVGQESDLVFLIEREKDKEKDSRTYYTNKTTITLAKNRKTGQTVKADFTMINGRFAYDDTADKADDSFEKFNKEKVEKKITESDMEKAAETASWYPDEDENDYE